MAQTVLGTLERAEVQNVQYRYHAKTENVVDGDTLDLCLLLYDGDQSMESKIRVRLADIDTHEINVSKDSDEYKKGMDEREFVVEWLTQAAFGSQDGEWPLTVETTEDKTGKFGRTLAAVYRKTDGERLSDALVAEFDDLVRRGD